MLRSFSAGTFIGPGDGAVPGAGCGKAVDMAAVEGHVTFDFLEHLVDVTVKHSHRAEALQDIRSAFTVSFPSPIPDKPPRGGCARKPQSVCSIQDPLRGLEPASCSSPSYPRPPAWRFKTLTSPMKWTPFLSKLYQPEPWPSSFQIPFTVEFSTTVEAIVLSRNVKNVLRLAAFSTSTKVSNSAGFDSCVMSPV